MKTRILFGLKIGICAIFTLLTVLRPSVGAGAAKPAQASLGVRVGDLAPEFSFQNAAGKWISLSDFRGKKVFLFSWATWCRCKEQLPALQKFYLENKSDKFEVVAVASDSQGFKWVQPYLDRAKATYIALVDPNNELAVKYNFLATENGFLVDESGVIRMSTIGFDIRNQEQKNELLKAMKAVYTVAGKAEKKSVEEQIAAIEAGLAENPKAFSKVLELAELYRRKGDYQKAEDKLREALKLKKNSAEAHYRLGVVLYQKGEIEPAVKEWEKAYKYESTNYLYMRNIEAYKEPQKFYSEMMDKEK